MRFHPIVASSAVLAALCSMLIGGCGQGTSEDEGSNPTLQGDELNGVSGEDTQGKITICHVPPGNPANAHTIVVGGPAWNGHRNHRGDYLGACDGQGSPPPGPQPDGGTPPPPPPPPPPGPTPDAGTPPPACSIEGAACGGSVVCCDGLQCAEGACQPIIN